VGPAAEFLHACARVSRPSAPRSAEPRNEEGEPILPNPTAILLATANPESAVAVLSLLQADGHHPLLASSPKAAIDLRGSRQAALAVVWLELPDQIGGLIRAIRGSSLHDDGIDPLTPLIAIDPLPSELGWLRSFDHGCDDYLPRSCSPLDLRARIAALLRRSRVRIGSNQVEVANIDADAHQARVGGVPLVLSRMELALLTRLASDPNRVFTKTELLRGLWGYRSAGHTRRVDSHASRLRRKLAEAGAGASLSNVWGVGYRLNNEPTEGAA
jgi:DNA-binding response OmpR family regulator